MSYQISSLLQTEMLNLYLQGLHKHLLYVLI